MPGSGAEAAVLLDGYLERADTAARLAQIETDGGKAARQRFATATPRTPRTTGNRRRGRYRGFRIGLAGRRGARSRLSKGGGLRPFAVRERVSSDGRHNLASRDRRR